MIVDEKARVAKTSDADPRKQELLWPPRQHPDELIIPDVHPTRFPGTWVAIFEESIPADQRNALQVNGFHIYRIRLLGNGKAQVVIREEQRPDRNGKLIHDESQDRYDQYDPKQ